MENKLEKKPVENYVVTDSHTGSGRKLQFTTRTAKTGIGDIVNNPYYINTDYKTKDGLKKGMNRSIQGNAGYKGTGTRPYVGSNLPNCVGWARGRYHEILHELSGKGDQTPFEYLNWSGDARTFYDNAKNYDKLPVGQTPMPGAIMVWTHGSYGHVAIVESVTEKGTCMCSESGWSFAKNNMGLVKFYERSIGNGNWFGGVHWGDASSYRFLGFVYNPLVTSGVQGVPGTLSYDYNSGSYDPDSGSTPTSFSLNTYSGGSLPEIKVDYEIQEREIEVVKQRMQTVEYSSELDRVKSANLLSYPSYVETPYVKVNIGGHDFGVVYHSSSNTSPSMTRQATVEYPNYMQRLKVTKVNGAVNTYEIDLVYQIEAGADPNLLDRIFASVGYGKIKISYGDMSSPTFIYREEEAIITKVTSRVEFSQSRISYTVYCTSTSLGLYANYHDFPEWPNKKPSEEIFELLSDNTNKYGLTEVFDGMRGKLDKVKELGLIATDDRAVDIPAKTHIDIISYINFLVTCMVSNSDDINNPLKNSTYYMTICDDTYDETYIDPMTGRKYLGGSYFKVTKVDSNTKTLATVDTYEIDIGYPGDNQVMSFNITDDNSWALLYNYSDDIHHQKYTYTIDDDGRMLTIDSPNITTSAVKNTTTPSQKSWWTQMTKFPISATLQIKGLVRTVMLMTYLRVNAIFYGQRHVSSGLYIITKQVDTIDGNGYRTELTLQRVGGDEDYLTSVTEKVTQKFRVRKGESQTESNTTAKKDWEEDREKWFGYVKEGSTNR